MLRGAGRSIVLAWVAIAAACGRRGAGTETERPIVRAPRVIGATADAVRDGEGRIRPEATAGLYWQAYVTCDECAPPVALVAYVAADAATARAIVEAIGPQLGLGRPYVLHTDELYGAGEHAGEGGGAAAGADVSDGAGDEAQDRRPAGVAVITGAFSTRAAAAAAAAGSEAIAGVAPAVIDVEGGYWSDDPRRVTAIDRGPPVPAWSADDVHEVEAALGALEDDEAPHTMEAQYAWALRALQRRAPACTVAPGELFVVDDAELDWYRFAPVRCGGRPAYVEWTRSLLGHAVIVDDDDGGHRLFQVVGAECDSPFIQEWRYDQDGRHPLEPADGSEGPPQLALGGC